MPIIFIVLSLIVNIMFFLQFLCFFLLNLPTSFPTEIADMRYIPLSLAVIFFLNIVLAVSHGLMIWKAKRLKEQ